MSGRHVLAPEAALDLVQIWRYVKRKASTEMAGRVESVIREKAVDTLCVGYWNYGSGTPRQAA
jgi:hypothetical protein